MPEVIPFYRKYLLMLLDSFHYNAEMSLYQTLASLVNEIISKYLVVLVSTYHLQKLHENTILMKVRICVQESIFMQNNAGHILNAAF